MARIIKWHWWKETRAHHLAHISCPLCTWFVQCISLLYAIIQWCVTRRMSTPSLWCLHCHDSPKWGGGNHEPLYLIRLTHLPPLCHYPMMHNPAHVYSLSTMFALPWFSWWSIFDVRNIVHYVLSNCQNFIAQFWRTQYFCVTYLKNWPRFVAQFMTCVILCFR